MTESKIQSQIQLALGSLPDVRVFRNNVGLFWAGQLLRRHPNGSVTLAHARPVRCGLVEGSGDLIGWRIRNGYAQFLSVEVKSDTGKPTPEQLNWLSRVNQSGGHAVVARSAEEARALIQP